MTLNETLQILAVIKVAYPNSFNNLSKADLEALTKLWERQFKEFEFDVVLTAVDSIISSDTSGFMPSIGKIKDMIYKLSQPDELTEMEAWAIVKKAIGRSGYYANEEYDKLPQDLKQLVGSSQQLHDWSQADSDEINTVVASNFMRSYRARAKYTREMAMIPDSVKLEMKNRLQLENTGFKRLGGTYEK